MKKKTLLKATLAGLFTVSLCTTAVIANTQPADTPEKAPNEALIQKDQIAPETPECAEKPAPPKKMSPEERRTEFEKRMNLTTEQKAKLESIKAEEQKKLTPIRNKMKKKHDEMRELIKSEAEIRKTSMEKFEAVLTPEQKAELEKMKTEIHEQMKHEYRPVGHHKGPKMGPGMEPPMGPGAEPPMGPPEHPMGLMSQPDRL